MAANTSQTLSCTAHFKKDAEKPWVTSDSPIQLNYWFNPITDLTLEDVAASIEEFARSQYRSDGQVLSFTIRGQAYSKETMVNFKAAEYLHDKEPFNLAYKHNLKKVRCTIL